VKEEFVMDEVEKRLKETGEACIKFYEAWRANQKDGAAREALQEAIHEIRKVASRVEIELAISERDEMAQKPIPIPPHRDATRRSADENDNAGNILEDHSQPQPQMSRPHSSNQQRRRPHHGGGKRTGGGGGAGGNSY
jgi:hypothetical protein